MKCEGVERSSDHNRHLPTDKRCDIIIVENPVCRFFDRFDHESLAPPGVKAQCLERSERSDASWRCCADAEVDQLQSRFRLLPPGFCYDASTENVVSITSNRHMALIWNNPPLRICVRIVLKNHD